MPTLTNTREEKTVEREILGLENRYWKAIQNRDAETALSMTDDPCLVAGASGVSLVDRNTFSKMMKNASYTLHDFELRKPEMRLLNDDVALLAYEVHEDMTVEGKRLSFEAAETSVWTRQDGKWVCALHTESLKGDPFGRDKAASSRSNS
jgi:ketosteroid isomerase-like protein